MIKHFGSMYRNLCFEPNLIQIIVDIVMLGYGPNIDVELCKTFLENKNALRQELHLVATRSFFCSVLNGRTCGGHQIYLFFVIELRGTWWPPNVLFFILDYNLT